MDFIQTHPKALIAASTLMNVADPRNWVFAIALFFLDLAVNTSSIYFVWGGEWPAVSCMLLGIFLMALKIPFIGFYFKYALEQKSALLAVFKKLDKDEDGFLTRDEAEKLILEMPKGTFGLEFSTAIEKYSFDNLLWCHYQPRMFTFRFLEFSVAWLMFFASLMLIKPNEPITAIVAVQMVVSVVSLVIVLNDFFDNYFRKYKSKMKFLKYLCMFAYGFTLLLVLCVLLAGYGFTMLIYNKGYNWVTVNTTAVPPEDLVGFVTGWILTAFVIIAFLTLAILNCLMAQLGCMRVEIQHLGEDDPIKLLGKKRPSLFSSRKKPDQQEVEPPMSTSTARSFENLPPPPPAIRVDKEIVTGPPMTTATSDAAHGGDQVVVL